MWAQPIYSQRILVKVSRERELQSDPKYSELSTIKSTTLAHFSFVVNWNISDNWDSSSLDYIRMRY